MKKLEKIIYFSTSILDTNTELMRESLIYGTNILKQNTNVMKD